MKYSLKSFFKGAVYLLIIITLPHCATRDNSSENNWSEYQGDGAKSHYSSLDQIKAGNLSKLKIAWEYASEHGDTSLAGTQIQCNPIIVDGVLYGVSPRTQLFAINAANGKELWRTNIQDNSATTSRGATYFADGSKKVIFFGAGRWIYCFNAKDGSSVRDFGDSGRIDLMKGVERPGADNYLTVNTPGIIYEKLLITGMRVNETETALLGDIRAYDVYTGKLQWTFHTIPQSNEPGAETWETKDPRTKIGGANSWAGLAIDRQRGIVYVPTGSTSYDFYGANRKGNNLYANCLLALQASTGKLLWHFQFVHHDLWDRDLPTTPNLLTVTVNRKKVDAVAQVTKQGLIFIFDRVTGKPLFDINEQPVATDGMPEEQYSPTQPIPTLPEPFTRQRFTINDINPSASNYQEILTKVKNARPGIPYMPITQQMTLFYPGTDGGAQWGGAGTDLDGIMYIPAKEVLCYTTLEKTAPPKSDLVSASSLYKINCASCHGPDKKGSRDGTFPSLIEAKNKYSDSAVLALLEHGRGRMPSFSSIPLTQRKLIADFILTNTDDHIIAASKPSILPYQHTGYNRWFDTEGYPVSRPPWGTLTAVNLNTGKRLWQVPLGEYKELTAKGIPETGTDNYGGPLITKSGLVFIAATRDEEFRAFDKNTGKILWKASLPAGGFATPSTYSVDGKQYIVIACGGGKLRQKCSDKYVAFALN